MPVDLGAVDRAAEMPEQGMEANPMEELSTGLQAIMAFVQAQMQKGDPAAQEAQAALEALIGAMGKMGQAMPEMAQAPPEAAAGGQTPLNRPETVLT